MVKIHNYKFKNGVYVLLKYDEMSPQFAKAVETIVIGQSLVLSVQLYSTISFDVHYNSFIIKSSATFVYTGVDNLSYYRPLNVRRSFDISNKNLYITLPCTY